MRPVLILGGYGNFGKRIAAALARTGVPIIISGRSRDKADALKRQLPSGLVEVSCFDAFAALDEALTTLRPSVVVNTCGPFQTSDYTIAECCIRHGVHYVDLADGRAFVNGITALDAQARQHDALVVSGASTVPGLSSAVLDHFKAEFAVIDTLAYGISPGQKAERGLATTKGILTYVGKPLKPFPGLRQTVYGWQDLYRQAYPEIGKRWMTNCDIPDLDLLPRHYGIKSIQFSAGLELSILHLGLWGLSWLVRTGMPLDLPRFAKPMLAASNWFDRFGSADGGMHIIMTGRDHDGRPHRRTWFIVAFDRHGPQIPTVPAILLARRLARGQIGDRGAKPCVGLVTLDDYLGELRDYPIRTY